MSYTIRHIKLFEGAPFKTLKKSDHSNDHSLNNINKVNNSIIDNIREQISKVVRIFLYVTLYVQKHGYGAYQYIPCMTIDEHTYSLDKYRCCMRIMNNNEPIDYDSINSIDSIGKSNFKINVIGLDKVDISIPVQLDSFGSIVMTKTGAFSTKELYIKGLDDILHGIYDDSFFEYIFNNSRMNKFDWKSTLEDALRITSKMTYNIKYELVPGLDNVPIKLRCYGIDSFEQIQDDIITLFDNTKCLKEYTIISTKCYNSFADSRDLSELLKIYSVFSKQISGRGPEYIFYYFDDPYKIPSSEPSSESMIPLRSDVKLRPGGINIDTLKKFNEPYTEVSIITLEPKKHGIKNSLIDELDISNEDGNNKFDSRFDKLVYIYWYWGRFYTKLSPAKQKAKLDKFTASVKAKNNTNNDEYNKYVVTYNMNTNYRTPYKNNVTITTVGC